MLRLLLRKETWALGALLLFLRYGLGALATQDLSSLPFIEVETHREYCSFVAELSGVCQIGDYWTWTTQQVNWIWFRDVGFWTCGILLGIWLLGVILVFVTGRADLRTVFKRASTSSVEPQSSAGQKSERLKEETVKSIQPYAREIMERVIAGEPTQQVAKSVALRAGVTEAQAALFIITLHESSKRRASETA